MRSTPNISPLPADNRFFSRRVVIRWGILLIGSAFVMLRAVESITPSPALPRVHSAYINGMPAPFFDGYYPKSLYVTPIELAPATNLRMFKKNANFPELLRSGDAVFEGDEVQIQYTTQNAFGVILSVDGRGVVSQHFPNKGAKSTRIKTGTHVLPFAFELDDAPGFEMFLFVSSDTPIPLNRILRIGANMKTATQPLSVSGNVQVEKVVLHKLPRE